MIKLQELAEVSDCRVYESASLSRWCTFRVGGNARYLVVVNSKEALKEAIVWAKRADVPHVLIGRGSNLVFDDAGYNGLIIINRLETTEGPGVVSEGEESYIVAGAGVNFAALSTRVSRNGWSGLEFGSGIPGTVGGAIYMNAGAHGYETKDALVEVEFLDEQGFFKKLPVDQLAMTYRKSLFQKERDWVILSAKFKLKRDEGARGRQLTWITKRLATQPWKERSAGCIFSNPEKDGKVVASAGALIDEAGCKGLQRGQVEVSDLHANFLVNKGGGSSGEILALVKKVFQEVKQHHHIELSSEVMYLPRQSHRPIPLLEAALQ